MGKILAFGKCKEKAIDFMRDAQSPVPIAVEDNMIAEYEIWMLESIGKEKKSDGGQSHLTRIELSFFFTARTPPSYIFALGCAACRAAEAGWPQPLPVDQGNGAAHIGPMKFPNVQ